MQLTMKVKQISKSVGPYNLVALLIEEDTSTYSSEQKNLTLHYFLELNNF